MKQYDALSPRPTQLQPRPEIARYGEATAHRNFTVIRIPVCTGWQLLVNAYLPYVVVYVCAFHEAINDKYLRSRQIYRWREFCVRHQRSGKESSSPSDGEYDASAKVARLCVLFTSNLCVVR